MSNPNAQLVRKLYDAFAAGDAGTVLAALHPQIEWREAESFVYADRNPYIGPQAVAEGVFTRLMTEWDGFAVRPERIVDGGDTVLATGRYTGAYRANGKRVDAQFAHVWTVRDGRVTAFQQYTDTAQFARVCEVVVPPPTA